MPIFLYEDESNKLGGKQLILPQYLVDHLRQQSELYSGKEYRNSKGYKRLMGMLHSDYNDPDGNKQKQHNDKHTMTWYGAKELARNIKAMSQTPDNLEYVMIGGDMTRDWVNNAVRSLRNSVKQVDKVPEVPKLDKGDVNIPNIKDTVHVNGTDIELESKESFNKKLKKMFE